MKKIIFSIILALAALNINAQLVVDSLGTVEISPFNPPEAFLPTPGYSTTIRPLGTGGILIQRPATDTHGSGYGINIDINGLGASVAGIYSNAKGYGLYTCGVKGLAELLNAHNPSTNLGIFGGLGYSTKGAGVYGTTTSTPSSLTPSGLYAGYFAGDVRVTGSIYGTVLSPTLLPNSREGGTSILGNDEENSVTEKLLNVEVLQTRRVNNNGSLAANKELEIPPMPEIDRSKLTEEQLQELETIEKNWSKEPIQTKFSDISYGLAAEQLKEVYPELVY